MHVRTQPHAVDCLPSGNRSQTPMNMKLGGPQYVHEKRKISCPCQESNPISPRHYRSQYLDKMCSYYVQRTWITQIVWQLGKTAFAEQSISKECKTYRNSTSTNRISHGSKKSSWTTRKSNSWLMDLFIIIYFLRSNSFSPWATRVGSPAERPLELPTQDPVETFPGTMWTNAVKLLLSTINM